MSAIVSGDLSGELSMEISTDGSADLSTEISIEAPDGSDEEAAAKATASPGKVSSVWETAQRAASARTPTGLELADSQDPPTDISASPPAMLPPDPVSPSAKTGPLASSATGTSTGASTGTSTGTPKSESATTQSGQPDSLTTLVPSDDAIEPVAPSGESPTPRVRLERLFGESETPGQTVRPTATPALNEVAQLLGRELKETTAVGKDTPEARELAVRLALLIWDGYGRPEVALPLLEGPPAVEHPVATSLRLQAALDGGQPTEALLALAERLRGRPDAAELRGEIGELLIFRGAYSQAVDLLADSGSRRMRALAQTLKGQRREAAAALEKGEAPSTTSSDLLWAAHLYEQAGSATAQAEGRSPFVDHQLRVLERAAEQTGAAPASDDAEGPALELAPLAAIERLYGLRLRSGTRQPLQALLTRKLELLGGLAALSESQSDLVVSPARALRRIELLGTALQLAGVLGEQGSGDADLQAATIYDAVAGFAARHKEAAAPLGRYLALVESARLCERRGERVAAAERFEALGLLLVDLGGLGAVSPKGGRSSDLAARLDLAAHAAALAYLLRAAELLTAGPEHGESGAATHAAALYSKLAEYGASDEALVLRRLSLLLPLGREGHTEVVASLSSLAESAPPSQSLHFAAWAARAAEALRIPGADVHFTFSDRAAAQGAPEQRRLDIEALARRARRRGDHPQLVQLYAELGRQLGATSGKPGVPTEQARAAAVHQAIAVVLQLGLTDGAHDSGETATLQAAVEHQARWPGGVLVDATRVLLLQRSIASKSSAPGPDFGKALTTLISRLKSRDTQIQIYRQLGHHAAEHAGDLTLAESSFHQVLQRIPDDVMALHALARLVQQRGEPAQAVALLQQAVEAALRMPRVQQVNPATGLPLLDRLLGRSTTDDRESRREVGTQAAALLCCELGALYEQLAHSSAEPTAAIDQAVACYSEALKRDPRCRPAARALVALYRSMQRPIEMLAAMELLLPLLRDDSQRLGLLLEMGDTAMQQALAVSIAVGDVSQATRNSYPKLVEQALHAYSEALALQPDQPAAIQHLTALCQRTQRYALLAESLQRAPRTLPVLDALRESYENLGETRQLAQVYEEQLGLLQQSGPDSRAASIAAARALALLYQRLEQPENAARTWERLYDLAPEELWNEVPVLLVLERRYGQDGRHTEQTALLSRALEHLQHQQARQPDDAGLRDRRRTLLLRLGDVQREHLDAVAQATATFEQVLKEWPAEPAAMRALVGLYGSQDRTQDQLRVLSGLLEVTVEVGDRSRLLFQLGELDEKQGHIEDAYKRYGQAFHLDPTNRGAFTAYERLCYRREQWQEAIRIYDTALKLIETQKTRSYRPADLYVRRGQVLLQYLQQTDEALQNYLRALETDAESDSTQATVERIYASRNQWRELLTAYERRAGLVREDIKRVEILRRAARVATAKLRDVAEAVRFYEKLHAVDPTDSEALDALEHHYDRSRDYEKLYGLLSTRVALSVDEQQIIALNMRIGVLCEEGLRDHDRAITAYRQIVEQQPTHREALDAMARLFEANERWAELIDVTRRQIRLVTDRSQKALLYFKCGSVTEAKFGKEDDAIRYYEAAVRTSAACLPALHSLRDIYIRREDWARVTQTLELESKLWTEDKERAGILAHIGQIYLDKLGAEARAIEFFEQALSVDKDCLPANRALFQIYFLRGDWERALGSSQVLLQKASREGEPSERSEFHRKRALVALHLGHLRMACDSVTTALDLYPENLQVLELMLSLCRRHNLGFDFGPLCRELEKQYRRRELPRCLARLLCAQAALAEPGAGVENTEEILKEAVRLAPDDHLPTEALAGLYERLRRFPAARATLEAFIAQVGDRPNDLGLVEMRARMQLRLAEMCSTAIMDAEQAAAVLKAMVNSGGSLVPPGIQREARFRLAQELYVLGRYPEARAEIELLLEQAQPPAAADAQKPGTATASTPSGEELARYHDYLGRILETVGEDAASQRAFRRAVDLDPSFAQPVLALARRAARGGDRAQAELLMRDALEQLGRRARQTSMVGSFGQVTNRESARLEEELCLRRGIARLLATFDPPQAAEAYGRIIEFSTQHLPPDALQAPSWLDDNREPRAAWETLDDRVALADLMLHKLNNTTGARTELHRAIRRDLRHAPAYPLLIELYTKSNQPDRADRVRALLSLLGYAGPGLPGFGERRTGPRLFAYRNTITPELRQRSLWPTALRGTPYFELLSLTLDGLQRLFPAPWPLDVETQPANKLWDPAFKVALTDAQRLFGIEVEVLFASHVPGYVLALEPLQPGTRPVVVMEQSVLERSDAERRFLLGRALESLRTGSALLLRLSSTEAAQWLRLCRGLLMTPSDRDPVTQEFFGQLPRPAQQAVDRLASTHIATQAQNAAAAASGTGSAPPSAEDFLNALPLLVDRAGLLFCDDIAAAARVMARAQGEELAVVEGHGGGILLGQVSGGAELARYYLSDSFHELVAALRDTSRL